MDLHAEVVSVVISTAQQLESLISDQSVSVIVVAIAIAISTFLLFSGLEYTLPLPPLTPADAVTNIRKKISQDGLSRFQHMISEFAAVKAERADFADGGAFRMRTIPYVSMDLIYVTDYKLARKVLLGDSSSGVSEGVKKNTIQSFNFVNRKISNIFT